MQVSLPKLCSPAYVYLVISMVVMIIMGYQNAGDNSSYCAGSYSCAATNTAFIFSLKLLYILFWTWILNLICKSGAPIVSWLLVMLPLLVMFILIGLYLIGGSRLFPLTQGGFV